MDLMRRLDRLDAWKSNFGQGAAGQLEKLLTGAATWRLRTPAEAVRFHETLLFLRAYPRSPRVARLADQILFHFADRIARLPIPAASISAGTAAMRSKDSAPSWPASSRCSPKIGRSKRTLLSASGSPPRARRAPPISHGFCSGSTRFRCLPASAPRSTALWICR